MPQYNVRDNNNKHLLYLYIIIIIIILWPRIFLYYIDIRMCPGVVLRINDNDFVAFIRYNNII